MFQEAGTWFWSHVVVALLLIWTDSNDTLEPAVNNFEKMLGIYQLMTFQLMKLFGVYRSKTKSVSVDESLCCGL